MPSFLVEDVLYCNKSCAMQDVPAISRSHAKRFIAQVGRELKPEEFDTRVFGALCPTCGKEYEEF